MAYCSIHIRIIVQPIGNHTFSAQYFHIGLCKVCVIRLVSVIIRALESDCIASLANGNHRFEGKWQHHPPG